MAKKNAVAPKRETLDVSGQDAQTYPVIYRPTLYGANQERDFYWNVEDMLEDYGEDVLTNTAVYRLEKIVDLKIR